MSTHTITLTQLELEIILDVLDAQAGRTRFTAKTLTDPALADFRENLEKNAAIYDDLRVRLSEIAYPDNNERASK